MPYLRNKDTGAFIGPMAFDGAEYLFLQALRSVDGRPTYEDVGTQQVGVTGSKFTQTAQALVDASGAAVDFTAVVARPAQSGFVSKVEYIPIAAVTGANTNSRTLNAINGGQAGAGAVSVATLPLVSGTNLVANASNPLTLSGTPANLVVVANDEIEFQSLHVGTGIADPGGLVIVTFTRE